MKRALLILGALAVVPAVVEADTTDRDGSEAIISQASDPGGLSDEDTATSPVAALPNSPVVVSPIPDTTVAEENPAIDDYRDLKTVFYDAEDGMVLTYTLESNSNPVLVTATVDVDDAVDLSFTADSFGVAEIVVRATDAGLLFAEDTFQVTVGDLIPPVITLISPPEDSLTLNPYMDLHLTVSDRNPTTVWIYGNKNASDFELLHVEENFSGSDIEYAWNAGTMEPDATDAMGLWHFDENGGTSVDDATAHGNDGQLSGSVLWSSQGRFGYALEFDGTDGVVEIPHASSLNIDPASGAITMEAWVYPRAGVGFLMSVVAKRGYGSRARVVNYEMAIQQFNNRLAFISGQESVVYLSDVLVPPNEWSHIAVTLGGIEGRARFFLNGVQADSIDGVALGPTHSEPLYIGAAGSTSESFDGMIDEVRLSSRLLSPEEIASNCALGRGTYYWKVLAEDSSSNASASETRSFRVHPDYCCVHRGDIDHSGGESPIDISDWVYLVDYMFMGGPEPVCHDEDDLDESGWETPIDISDLVYLADYMFTGGPEPPPCP